MPSTTTTTGAVPTSALHAPRPAPRRRGNAFDGHGRPLDDQAAGLVADIREISMIRVRGRAHVAEGFSDSAETSSIPFS
jgi:hypothetical protein